jgi:hypothetical protein
MDVRVIKDVVRCPTCGGSEIVYTCEPKCCFNHLCADCRTTFQLLTKKTPRTWQAEPVRAEEPPSGDPIAACAACECLRLAVVADDGGTSIVCGACNSVLELDYQDVAAEG